MADLFIVFLVELAGWLPWGPRPRDADGRRGHDKNPSLRAVASSLLFLVVVGALFGLSVFLIINLITGRR